MFRLSRPLAGLAAALLAVVRLAAQPAPTFANVTVHDPSVVRDGSTYYVFGSHLASASSTDLMHWTQFTRDWNATTNPGCVLIRNNSPQTEFAAALSYTTPPDFWAPDVRKLGDGRYYFYYCVCNNTSRSALGLAVADAITGPYANVSIMLESGMNGLSPDGTVYNNAVHPNVVDPSVFTDNTGKLWMVYGSYSGGIFILSLDPATGQPYPGQAYGKKLTGGNNCRIEGAFILYSPETAYYYMFFTFGGLDANGGYNIRVGRSRNPDGPYLDAAGNDLTNVHGAPNTVFDDASIAPYGVKLMGNYQFLHVAADPQTTSRGYVSPGGTSAYYDASSGRYLMVFHTRFVGQGEVHEVRVHQFFLNADGWPVVAPQRYAQESMATTDITQIPGDFKLINHGKDITATVKTSTVVTLNADHSISGAATGTWQLSGDHYATLTVGGTTYDGVFVHLWDDDNQVWTQTFTATSNDGVSLWGTKVAANVSPAFLTGPASQAVTAGSVVTLAVVASGQPTPTLQWRKDGAPLSGATGSTYAIASAAPGDAGVYTVVATNIAGAATSAAATLTVNVVTSAPVFTLQPASQTVAAGGAVTFNAVASGVPTPTLQWQKNGVNLAGATGGSYAIAAVAAADAGTYAVVATNSAGTATSSAAVLTVNALPGTPVFTVQPTGQAATMGGTVTFTAAAMGTPAPTLQWVKNGVPLAGATGSAYTIAGVTAAAAADYRVVATNSVGTATSAAATLVVSAPIYPAGFDALSYLARYPDLAAAFGGDLNAAWLHYLNYGIYEGRFFDNLFRPDEYLALYPDLWAAFGPDRKAALLHWLTYGRAEGRLGRVPPTFDLALYLARYADLQAAFGGLPEGQRNVAVWFHYLDYGVYEGRSDGDFDVHAYLAAYGDLAAAFGTNLEAAAFHWYIYGRYEGRRIPPNFDVRGYLARYPDIVAAYTYGSGVAPDLYGAWLHYYDYGINEGRVFDDLFRVDEYLMLYADLRAAFGTDRQAALMHWLTYGKAEGRMGRFP